MIVWPVSLPSPLLDGFREVMPDNLVRSEVDQGIAKTRKRSSAAPAQINVNYLLTKSQVATLESFYKETTAFGLLRFDYTHPRTAVVLNCRLKQPPAISAQNGSYFRVSLELEVLP